ncbi:MAG: 1-propanol dehydrogenase PduQ [Cellulosilyticaceae bacterium]
MSTFEIKTKIEFGPNALDYIKSIKGQKVFIVTDPFMVKSGTIGKITDHLSGTNYTVFSDIVPDPPIELVVKGVEAVIQFGPQVIIALGGGSAIDAAKAIMDFAKKIGELKEMMFIAVPTTSGTGSEVTSFAVITDKQKGTKYPLVSDELLPDVAILDPELVKTVPPAIVADTGMDVLTHALEAYVSTKATDFSDALAQKAVELVFDYLERSYKDSNDMEAKEKMHNASCLAGLAFNLTSLGINHAIAHVIGGKLHIPHGRTNALLLPHVIDFNAQIEGFETRNYSRAAKRYAHVAKVVGIPGSNVRMLVKNLIHRIVTMQKAMNMPTTVRGCKIEAAAFNEVRDEIAKLALEDACIQTNPRTATAADVLKILSKIS